MKKNVLKLIALFGMIISISVFFSCKFEPIGISTENEVYYRDIIFSEHERQ